MTTYRRARRMVGVCALMVLATGCDQQLTQPEPAVTAVQPLDAEAAAMLAAIVDDACTRVVPVLEDVKASAGVAGALQQLRAGLAARDAAAVSLARVRLADAIETAESGPDGSTNAADLEVIRLLLEQMDTALTPPTL